MLWPIVHFVVPLGSSGEGDTHPTWELQVGTGVGGWVPYLVWRVASHGGSDVGMASVDCRQNQLVIAPRGNPKPNQPHPCLGATLSPWAAHSQGLGVAQMCPPQDILAERWEGVLLVMAKHLKHNWLALDVFDERFCHLHSNLKEKVLLSH